MTVPLRKVRTLDGPLTIETEVDGKITKEYFRGARVGLEWPSPDNTGGYFCILAQKDMKLITGQYPLKVVGEHKALTMNELFNKLFDEMGVYGCTEICTDMSRKHESFYQAMDEVRRKKRPKQEIRVKDAPYCSSFLHGVEMIKKWMREVKGLEVPRESVIHSQLREIREGDLGDSSTKFFAINALRYVLGEFEVSDIPKYIKGVIDKGISPRAWT